MFSSCNDWNNGFIPQTDQNEFYEFYNELSLSAVCASGGCVCGGKSGENPIYSPSQPQPQYTMMEQFSETLSLNAANIFRTFPTTTTEESVNFNNDEHKNNYNNNDYHNSVKYEINTCSYYNNNNNSTYSFYGNENVYPQQQQYQQQTQQFRYINFVNTQQQQQPQHQQQSTQQQVALLNPSVGQQLLPAPVQRPAATQHFKFQPPPAFRTLNYNNNFHQSQQPQYHTQQYETQQQQFNQQSLGARTPSLPCQGNQPWTYAYCYGYGAYANEEPCQFTQIVDIEDFMNNEKRKERSRDAARCRRSRETEIFTEMAQALPLKKEDVQQLDKASVMRIAISYLKVRDMLKMFPKIQELFNDLQLSNDNSSNESNEANADTSALNNSFDSNDSSSQSSQVTDDSTQQESVESDNSSPAADINRSAEGVEDFSLLLKQTLDGFLLILSNEGDITYVTGNISDYLGLSKIDILGQQIWEYAHQCDHAELKAALNIKRNRLTEKIKDEKLMEEGISTDHRDLFVRLKCTITSRGRSINIKSASYKVIHITGHLVVNTKGDRVLVAMGRPIPHPCNIEVPLGTSTFLTKHSLDMKFTYVDDKMFNLLGYKPEDLLETSLFNCHHGIDSDSLMTTFKNVLSKGQGETCRYRFLGKYGGYCWIVTQATIVYDKLKPQSVVCVNFVISNLEKKNEIYTLQQFEESQKLKLEDKKEKLNENKPEEEEKVVKDQLKEEKAYSTAELNNTIEPATTTTTKVESTTPPPTPLNHNNNNNNKHNQQIINNNNNNNNNKNINEDIKNIQTIIKLEQIAPPPVVTINNNQSKLSTTATVAETLNNSSLLPTPTTTSTKIIKTVIVPPQQLPTAPYCPTTTVTHTIFNKTIATSKLASDDKRPKPITSSLLLTNLPTTTSTQSILQHQNLNVTTTRAPQSVTASVFSPLPPPKLPSTTATAAILAQQTQTEEGGNATHQQDMNKGYLSFAEDATELTMLKEEPDDLTAHLVATNAVDACMPLDESGPLFGEILVGFGMGSYGSLLPDDINSLDSNTSSTDPSNNNNNNNNNSNNQTILKSSCTTNTCSSTAASPTTSSATSYNAATSSHSLRQSSSPSLITTTTCATNNNNISTATANSTNIDPFINYRDESNDTNCSQHLLSPSVTSKSPEGSSLPSLCSPNSLSQEDEFSYYTMNVDDMDDLTMRAPYIPMNEQDDLPLLTSDDYMWSSGNAFTPDEFSLHTKDSDSLQVLQINQSLNYQQQQFTQQQQQTQQYSNSLCSSPASTVSSMSPSPLQQQQNSQQIFSADSSELAALLCGTGNGDLSILQDAANFTNSLNLNSGSESSLIGGGGGNVNVNNCSNQNLNNNNNNNNSSNIVGADESGGVGLNGNDLDSVSMDHHQQMQQHCLQQLQEQLQHQHQRQQQQQHQQLLSGLNINCKKEKFETANNSPSLTPNLCDTIDDTFDNVVYSKNSTNLDCWNEFLQISSNDNNNTTNNVAASAGQQRQEDCKQQLHMQLQQQQQQQTQNIILNAVPLITIETNASNNKNVLMQTLNNQQQHQQQLAPQSPQSNTKSLNKINAIKLTPITSTATIKIIENKQSNNSLLQHQTQQQPQQKQRQNIIKTAFIQATPMVATSTVATALHNNNKRHLSATQIANNALDSKRLKSNIMDLQNSTKPSQLLQQLITTPQQQHQQGTLNMKTAKGHLESRWSSTSENQTLAQQQQQKQQQQQQQQQQKQSNSVLKNLLISGCDKTDLTKPEITIIDGSRSSMQSPELCLSPTLTRPLQCVTSPSTLLRNYRHNPWIGGPGNLPSPTSSLITNEDSNPPGLTPCDAIDSASDSGIDDISIAENMSPLKRTFEQQKKQIENVFGMKAATIIVNNNNNNLNTDNNNNKGYNNNNDTNLRKLSNFKIQDILKANATKPNIAVMQEMELTRKIDEFVQEEEEEEEEEDGATLCKRKKSLSYLDSSNPLMTPFLMDLCNDDYHMNTKDYLQENDIENVLNDWPVDLV